MIGVVERFYLLCPWCGGRQDLDRRVCPGCGSKPVSVWWTPPATPWSPELSLIERTNNRAS